MIDTTSALSFYEKTKKDWNLRASVRASKETYDLNFFEAKTNEDLNWHVPSYCTILQHSALKKITKEDKKYIMGMQLLEFVEKTAIFEIEYVNKVANNIALGKYKFEIPNVLKLDALKIYTDEGYHAHFSKKMADDIKNIYNIKESLDIYLKDFFGSIKNIGSSFGKEYFYLSEISSTIISESMIVQDMSNEMKGIVYDPIRLMFKDHVNDEIFHANFFSTFFKIIWPQLSENEKAIMGHCLHESMIIFSAPRTDIYYFALSKFGYNSKEIDLIITDVFKKDVEQSKRIKKRMSQTLLLLDRCGVFTVNSICKLFKDSKFI